MVTDLWPWTDLHFSALLKIERTESFMKICREENDREDVRLDCEQSLFFFRFSEAKRARVSGVLLDGPREKRDCS